MRRVRRMLLCLLAVPLLGAQPAAGLTAVAQVVGFTVTYAPGLGVMPTPVAFSMSSMFITESGVVDNRPVVGATASCSASGDSLVPAHVAQFVGRGTWTCTGGGGSGELFVVQSGGHAVMFWTGARSIVLECIVQTHTHPPDLVTSASFTCVGPAAAL